MNRITDKNLETLCATLNRVTNSPESGWERIEERNVANIGHYYIDGAYGGVALARIVNDGGGVRMIIERCTKRELYDQMHAFLRGYEAASA